MSFNNVYKVKHVTPTYDCHISIYYHVILSHHMILYCHISITSIYEIYQYYHPLSYGYWSKPWHLVNPKIAGKWMFIPLELIIIGFDPPPYGEIIYLWGNSPEIQTMFQY